MKSSSISPDQKFKHAPHVAWRRIEEEAVILDLNTSKYFSLNPTSAFIWEKLGDGLTPKQVSQQLCQEYDVDAETAQKDIEELIGELCKINTLVGA